MVKIEEVTEKPSVAIRIFLAGVFAYILYSFVEEYVRGFFANRFPLPLFLSQALFFGVLVLALDFIMKKMGV